MQVTNIFEKHECINATIENVSATQVLFKNSSMNCAVASNNLNDVAHALCSLHAVTMRDLPRLRRKPFLKWEAVFLRALV
jgi:hypothetical protein